MITKQRAIKLRELMELGAKSFDDATALEGVELFPQWSDSHDYTVDDRISYEGLLYKCVQSHTSQPSWTPDLTPALWVRVTVEEWPEWVQPIGAQDAYMTGDKVSHNERHWVSITDNNVWEPGVYGWELA